MLPPNQCESYKTICAYATNYVSFLIKLRKKLHRHRNNWYSRYNRNQKAAPIGYCASFLFQSFRCDSERCRKKNHRNDCHACHIFHKQEPNIASHENRLQTRYIIPGGKQIGNHLNRNRHRTDLEKRARKDKIRQKR